MLTSVTIIIIDLEEGRECFRYQVGIEILFCSFLFISFKFLPLMKRKGGRR